MTMSGGLTGVTEPFTLSGSGISLGGALVNTSGTNTVTGLITLGADAEIQSTTGALTLNVASGNAIEGTNKNLTLDAAGTITVSDPIGIGSGTLTKQGASTATLSSGSDFTGSTTITAGTLSIGADSALGTAPGSATPGHLTLNGGTLSTTATFTLNANRGIALGASDGTMSVASGTTLTYGGVVAGSVGSDLTKAAAGTFTLTGANTYAGTTTISGGSVVIGSGGSLGAGSYAGTISVASGSTLTYSSSTGQTLSGIISGAGSIVKDTSTSTLTLSASNSYTGSTTVSAGAIVATTNTSLGATSGTTTVNDGGAIHLSGTGLSIAEPLSITGSGVSSSGAVRNLSTAGNDTNTLSGAITLAAASEIQSDDGTLTIDVSSGNAIAGTFALTFDGSGNVTVADPIATSTGTLTKSGSGTLTLSAVNTYSGNTTISAGNMTISGAGSLDSGTYAGQISIASGSVFTYSSSATQTLSGKLTGAGAVTKDTSNSSTLTLSSSTSDYTGATTISNGTVVVKTSSALGGYGSGEGTTIASGAALNLDGASGDLSIAEPFTVSGTGSSSTGAIRSLSTVGTDVHTLSGAITLGASSEFQVDAGSITLSATTAVTTATSKNLTVDGAGDVTISGKITGDGALTSTLTGVLTLSAANDYTGATSISSGTAVASNSASFGASTTGTTVSANAAVNLSGTGLSIPEPFTVSGTGSSSTGAFATSRRQGQTRTRSRVRSPWRRTHRSEVMTER
ncbi:MAG: hypothetical protein EBQ75_00815 [Actinobacteria bacterium]|nr:hypothetical protein [Actinomycetota bacterium]